MGLISVVLMLGWRRTYMVTPNDPTLVVLSKPCQSAQTRKKLVMYLYMCKQEIPDFGFVIEANTASL